MGSTFGQFIAPLWSIVRVVDDLFNCKFDVILTVHRH